MTNQRNGTLYVGVTNNISRRASEHRTDAGSHFTRHYKCHLLVWYERHERMDEAIAREKQIKSGSRRAKLKLIETMNPQWLDLYETLGN